MSADSEALLGACSATKQAIAVRAAQQGPHSNLCQLLAALESTRDPMQPVTGAGADDIRAAVEHHAGPAQGLSPNLTPLALMFMGGAGAGGDDARAAVEHHDGPWQAHAAPPDAAGRLQGRHPVLPPHGLPGVAPEAPIVPALPCMPGPLHGPVQKAVWLQPVGDCCQAFECWLFEGAVERVMGLSMPGLRAPVCRCAVECGSGWAVCQAAAV